MTIYPQCVDWVWIRTCHGCDRAIPVGTEHVQVIDTDKPHSHLPHEMPISYFHPLCAPLHPVDPDEHLEPGVGL